MEFIPSLSNKKLLFYNFRRIFSEFLLYFLKFPPNFFRIFAIIFRNFFGIFLAFFEYFSEISVEFFLKFNKMFSKL